MIVYDAILNKSTPPRMYDVDGNGVIDQEEMTKIVQAIYDMLGAGAVKPTDTAEERAKNIFNRWEMFTLISLTAENCNY